MRNIRNNIGLIGTFLLFPFLAFLFAVRNFKLKESKLIVYCFFILFGLTLVLGNDQLDSFRYAKNFQEMSKLTLSDFKTLLGNFLASERTLDLAQPALSFFVSRFTDNYHFYFGVIASIFSFFYIKSINIVHNKFNQNKTFLSLMFLLFFILIINPIFNINGFRYWTATWIFFLGSYFIVTSKQKKYIFLCFLAVFFHFSFIAPNIVLIAYLIMGNRNKIYFILLLGSFFISDVVLQLFPHIITHFGEGIAAKTGRYASLDRIEQVAEHANWALEQGKWYLYLPGELAFYFIFFSFMYLSYKYKHFIKTPELENLFSFSLFFLAFSNTVSFIPSMGRFRTLFLLFGLAFIIILLTVSKAKKMNLLLSIGLLIFIINLVVVLRLGIDLLNPWLFTLLPLPFIFDNGSIYQLLFN